MRYFERMSAPQKEASHRFHYTLKALLALLTIAALLFAVLARFGVKSIFAILYCVWILAPLWVPFCWTYLETQAPQKMK